MKFIPLFVVLLSAAWADSTASSDELTKSNTIKPSQPIKVPSYYQVYNRPSYITKPIYQPAPAPTHHHQPTMLIIAQPAYVPHNLLYGQIAQQLLHYFHTNPQAKYLFTHGGGGGGGYQQPHPTAQTYVAPSHHHQQYQYVLASPQHQTYNYVQQPQQYIPHYQTSAPIKTAPPIVTGFEHFTPEQQAQIKEQLSAHFGGGLTPISGSGTTTHDYATKYDEPSAKDYSSAAQSYTTTQDDGGKADMAHSNTYASSAYRSHYHKG